MAKIIGDPVFTPLEARSDGTQRTDTEVDGVLLSSALYHLAIPIIVSRFTYPDGRLRFVVQRDVDLTEVSIAPDGSALHVLLGGKPQNDDGEDLVGEHFGRRLVSDGRLPATFRNEELPQADDGDRLLSAEGTELVLQIVRPTNAPFEVWNGNPGAFQRIDRSHLAEGIAGGISTKAKKNYSRRSELFLLVDGVRFGAHATPEVIETFKAAYPTLAKDVGFREVWVVGPLPELVWRLGA